MPRHRALRYAGYQNPDGTIEGDPSNVQFTKASLYPTFDGAEEKKALMISMQLLVDVYSFASLWDGRRKKGLNSMFFLWSFKLRALHPKFSYFQMTSYFKFL